MNCCKCNRAHPSPLVFGRWCYRCWHAHPLPVLLDAWDCSQCKPAPYNAPHEAARGRPLPPSAIQPRREKPPPETDKRYSELFRKT